MKMTRPQRTRLLEWIRYGLASGLLQFSPSTGSKVELKMTKLSIDLSSK